MPGDLTFGFLHLCNNAWIMNSKSDSKEWINNNHLLHIVCQCTLPYHSQINNKLHWKKVNSLNQERFSFRNTIYHPKASERKRKSFWVVRSVCFLSLGAFSWWYVQKQLSTSWWSSKHRIDFLAAIFVRKQKLKVV